jgi:hypothetical protein
MLNLKIPKQYAFHIPAGEIEPRTIIVCDVGDERGSLEYYMCVLNHRDGKQFVDLETGELVILSKDQLVAKVEAELIIGPQNTNH